MITIWISCSVFIYILQCTTFLLSSLCWCLDNAHESSLRLLLQDFLEIGSRLLMIILWITPRSSCIDHLDRHFLFIFQPWSQHMVQGWYMDKSYKHNSTNTLVHRDFNHLAKNIHGAPCSFTIVGFEYAYLACQFMIVILSWGSVWTITTRFYYLW
jgi:hypothetical protein